MTTGKWNLANLISIYRIIAIPFLLMMIIYDQRFLFSVLLMISLVSDIADGIIARALKLQTELGARLDSIGDMGTYLTSVIALFAFELQFIKSNIVAIGIVIVLYAIEAIIALTKFGKISSFHTILCKVAAYCQGIFMVVLFLYNFQSWLFYPTVIVSSLAYLEEIAIVFILPENRSNVKGIRQAFLIKQENVI